MNRTVLTIAATAAAYVLIELLSLLILAGVRHVKPNAFGFSVEEHFKGLDDQYLRDYLSADYHALLGWDHKPGSKQTSRTCLGGEWTESFDVDGARTTPIQFDTDLIASYGDSYVKGGELNNDQTWQFQLAQEIGVGVKNYAVGASEPYQAVLKIKMHMEQGNVYPITVLGINEQNIKRTLNLFRPFIYRNVSAKLAFKPGLTCEDGACVTVPNLLQPQTTTINEAKEAARYARRLDYWARNKPVMEYSWFVNLVKLIKLTISVGYKSTGEAFWESPDALAAMDLVVSEFREVTRAADSMPVVLFIPERPKADIMPSYSEFKRQIEQKYPDLVVLDVMDREFDTERFKLKPSGDCHPSEYGHGVIAETVREGLRSVLQARIAAINEPASRQ